MPDRCRASVQSLTWSCDHNRLHTEHAPKGSRPRKETSPTKTSMRLIPEHSYISLQSLDINARPLARQALRLAPTLGKQHRHAVAMIHEQYPGVSTMDVYSTGGSERPMQVLH